MKSTTPEVYNVQKAASLLGVNPATIRRWAKTGQLQGIKVGTRGDWRFTQEELKNVTRTPHLKKELYKFLKIKKLLTQHADDIQKLASKHHKIFLGTSVQFRSQYIDKYQKNHIRIVKEFAKNLDKELKVGISIFKSLGETLAKDSVKDGLTIEEAVDGIIFLKQAVWQELDEAGLLDELNSKDFYEISQAIGTYTDVVASKIAFTYHEYYKKQAKELDERKNEFIGMASHELKTPVTSLKAYLQLMQAQLKRKGEEDFVKQLQKMERQVDKLTILIRDLLDLSKIQEGKSELRKEVLPVDEVIKETVESLKGITETHKLILDGQTRRKIYADRDRIEQVLNNLIMNAIKYSPQANKVIIKSKANKDKITISIQDFGIGIAKEHQKKIFDRFFRVEGVHEKTYPGFGIGLYIASEIIKRHNGKMWVESKLGKGSTFSFSLPVYKKQKLNS